MKNTTIPIKIMAIAPAFLQDNCSRKKNQDKQGTNK